MSEVDLVVAPWWYVVVTGPNREERAAERLTARGLTVYWPKAKRTIRLKHRRNLNGAPETVERPAFPRYLFVAILSGLAVWRTILDTPGVLGILHWGEAPLRVRGGLIEAVQVAEDMGQFDEATGDAKAKPAEIVLHEGDQVVITAGPATGYRAEVKSMVGKQYASILVDMNGKPAIRPIKVALDLLTIVA